LLEIGYKKYYIKTIADGEKIFLVIRLKSSYVAKGDESALWTTGFLATSIEPIMPENIPDQAQ